jgi:hypothetical protein
MTGRPTIRTPEMVDDILARLSNGEPLAAICRTDGYPHPSTFRDWVNADEELSRRFARAREVGFDAIAEQALDIADDERHDWVLSKKGEVTDEVAIGRARLRVETRLKLLAKWDPKRYGDKLELAGDAKAPLTVHVVKLTDGGSQ